MTNSAEGVPTREEAIKSIKSLHRREYYLSLYDGRTIGGLLDEVARVIGNDEVKERIGAGASKTEIVNAYRDNEIAKLKSQYSEIEKQWDASLTPDELAEIQKEAKGDFDAHNIADRTVDDVDLERI